MNLPAYWLPRPDIPGDEQTRSAFDRLLDRYLTPGDNQIIAYTAAAPKWQFLCHAAERHAIALHGSQNPDITRFEPRQSLDLNAFGNQKAVYAASDGIWAMFFAIIDRDRYPMTINNACVRLAGADRTMHGPFYFFSVSKTALVHQPWRAGTVYLLPRATFKAQPPMPFGAGEVHIAQLASPSPVRPLARLTITPDDFPFLAQVRGHDDARLKEYATALQTGGAWPDDE